MAKAEVCPGTTPRLAGYWAFQWQAERKPPNWLPGHTDEYQREWLQGWDEARERDERMV